MFNIVQKILGNSIGGYAINLTDKIPIFFVTKHWNRKDLYLSMHFTNFQICHNLLPFGNLSHGVFLLVDLFFRL